MLIRRKKVWAYRELTDLNLDIVKLLLEVGQLLVADHGVFGGGGHLRW
jgi:hypothetical protein